MALLGPSYNVFENDIKTSMLCIRKYPILEILIKYFNDLFTDLVSGDNFNFGFFALYLFLLLKKLESGIFEKGGTRLSLAISFKGDLEPYCRQSGEP